MTTTRDLLVALWLNQLCLPASTTLANLVELRLSSLRPPPTNA